MNHKLAAVAAIMLTAAACGTNPQATTIQLSDIALGDPFLLQAPDGTFYLYGTSGFNGFNVYTSKDLENWEFEAVAFDAASQEYKWGVDCFWAPEVYYRDGRYYMFYSSNWRENPAGDLEVFRIGVAASDSPAGPFMNISDKPVFDPGYPIIDANVLFDDESGKTYLYYSRCCYKHSVESELSEWAKEKGLFDSIEESWVYGVEMLPDFSGVVGEPVLLLRPPYEMGNPQSEWESRSVTSGEVGRRWTEGSYIIKEGGKYYMMYSANYFGGGDYAVGYATSDNPLGPFEKSADNPVLQKNGVVTGTGHCMSVTLGKNDMRCVYHGRTSETGDARIVFISPMRITSDGHLEVNM